MRRVIAVNMLVLAVGLVCLELAFGSWFARTPALYHFTQPRNVTLRYQSTLPGQPALTTYSRDRYGLRGRYRSADDIFILTVGGSTTDQRYLDEDRTFQARLAALYAEAGRPVDIVNAGVDGQSTFGHLAAFDDWLDRLPGLLPRYVLFYIGINDFYSLDGRSGHDRVSGGWWLGVRNVVADKSAVLALTRVLSGLARPPAVAHRMEHGVDTPGTWAMTGERRRQSYLTPAVETSLAGLGSRVAELARRARKIGAEPIVVTQRSMFWRRRDGRIEGVREWAPDRFSPALAGLGALTGVDRHYLERLQAEAILAACRAANGICLDLAAELAPDPATDFYDGFHTTPAGADRIARYLHARLGGLR